jgi:hypothetical protein
VEDANLTHIARIEAYVDLLADVRGQGKRNIPKLVEVDAILANPTRSNLFHQEQVELF